MKDFFYFRQQQGFSLIEVLVVITVIGILASLATPSFNETIARRRIQGATEKLYADLQFTRSEAIKTNTKLFLNFDVTNACYGRAIVNNCNCNTNVPACDKIYNLSDFNDVSFDNASFAGGVTYTSFDPVGGTATNGGVVLKNRFATKVVLSLLGRVRKCTPPTADLPAGTKAMYGYPDC